MEKKKNTKEAILYEALNLFSIYGYEGVSIRDLAKVVGIKESSIYNHYSSKQAIFNAIIEEMSLKYDEIIHGLSIPNGDISSNAKTYEAMCETTLLDISKGLFLFFLTDPYASKFRRMLTIEQYQNPLATQTFTNFFINGALTYQSALFSHMREDKYFKSMDNMVMALHFYAPIFLLLYKYDHLPDRQEEALSLIEMHVKQFTMLYH